MTFLNLAGSAVNAVTSNGDSPLHIAVSHVGGKGLWKFLLTKGANINLKNYENETPLAVAAKNRHFEVCMGLIKAGAKVDLPIEICNKVLNFTAETEAQEHYRCYLPPYSHKIYTFKWTGFESWFKHCNVSNPDNMGICQKLIEAGADPNILAKYGDPDLFQQSVLHRAAKLGSIGNCFAVIESGIDVNCVNVDGNTPLHYAVEEGQLKICLFLIENGADTKAANSLGNTPLHIASSVYGQVEICRLLLDSKADIESRNLKNETPLMVAGRRKNYEACCLLLRAGATLNLSEEVKKLLLNFAVEFGDVSVSLKLMESGTDSDVLDKLELRDSGIYAEIAKHGARNLEGNIPIKF